MGADEGSERSRALQADDPLFEDRRDERFDDPPAPRNPQAGPASVRVSHERMLRDEPRRIVAFPEEFRCSLDSFPCALAPRLAAEIGQAGLGEAQGRGTRAGEGGAPDGTVLADLKGGISPAAAQAGESEPDVRRMGRSPPARTVRCRCIVTPCRSTHTDSLGTASDSAGEFGRSQRFGCAETLRGRAFHVRVPGQCAPTVRCCLRIGSIRTLVRSQPEHVSTYSGRVTCLTWAAFGVSCAGE